MPKDHPQENTKTKSDGLIGRLFRSSIRSWRQIFERPRKPALESDAASEVATNASVADNDDIHPDYRTNAFTKSGTAFANLKNTVHEIEARRDTLRKASDGLLHAIAARELGSIQIISVVIRIGIASIWTIVAAKLFFVRTNTMLLGKTTTASGVPIDHAATLYDYYLILAAAGIVCSIAILVIAHLDGRLSNQNIYSKSEALGRILASDLKSFSQQLGNLRRKKRAHPEFFSERIGASEINGGIFETYTYLNTLKFLKPANYLESATPQILRRYVEFMQRMRRGGSFDLDNDGLMNKFLETALGFVPVLIGVIVLTPGVFLISDAQNFNTAPMGEQWILSIYEGHFAILLGGVALYASAGLIASLTVHAAFRKRHDRRIEKSFRAMQSSIEREGAPSILELSNNMELLLADEQ